MSFFLSSLGGKGRKGLSLDERALRSHVREKIILNLAG